MVTNIQDCGTSGDLICTQDRNGRGVSRCHKRFEEGSFCTRDDECARHLKCGGWYPLGKCYNPKHTLRLGETCSPGAKSSEKNCVVAKDGSPMRCLAKNNGYACQKMNEMYQRCDVDKNIGCSPVGNTFCSKDGVCFPHAKVMRRY